MSHTPLEDPIDPAEAVDSDGLGRPAAHTAWSRFRPVLLRLHFYAGVFVGPFILIAALTGLMYALIPQIDKMSTRHERIVEQVGDQRLPLADQIAAARNFYFQNAHPEGAVASIRPPAAPDETTQITLNVTDVPPDYARTVFVDPYTGEVRGALTTFGEWMPLRAWFDELHRNLHLGAVGRHYSELAASWLWVIALAGLALWVGHRVGTGRLRRLLVPDRDAGGRRRRLISWHGALGTWIIAGLLLLSVSGMTWSRWAGQSIDVLQSHLNQKAPSVDTTLVQAQPVASAPASGHVHGAASELSTEFSESEAMRGADVAFRAAQDAHLVNPIWMYPPAQAGQGWHVAENKRSWPTRYDAISVDPDNGAITDRVNFADWPFLAKLTDWIIGAHMGILFGVPNQLLLATTAIALITAIILGYRMWWRRRPIRGGPPTGPRRGALMGLRPHEAVIVVLVLAAVGWFAPLFGLTLAIFVAVDVILGWRKGRVAGSNV